MYERIPPESEEVHSSPQQNPSFSSTQSHSIGPSHDPLAYECPPPQTQQTQQSSSSYSTFIPGGRDGVFSNLSAKPEVKKHQDSELPQYYDVVDQEADPTPPYIEHSVVSSLVETGDVLIDGFPVGMNVF